MNMRNAFHKSWKKFRQFLLAILSCSLVVMFAGCGTQNATQYEAAALTILTWQANYANTSTEGKLGRFEEFASVSLLNINGERPENAAFGPDDQGLWWAKIPPKPSLDEIEARQKRAYEKPGKPELLRQVKYHITYQQDGQNITLPTNHAVYRQVVKAYPKNIPLQLTMGINNGSVEKATPINN
ncbi:hypothetical protein Xen7305DRAFT_00013890 [Xenococcus sp. PCC 7305]|uniref:hypothetical protein n=1 Tax=Xenococcus sp. PCC 7305 TaxID=102125 RepID=UPI0002ABCE3B|nr:hypothetical protein [Xenococcus sp. PCC 7305]ELS01684.1 hypothetical protein Xen7305DRAFT_00013890 [Xenococcus sp. PCC 7305]